MFSRTARAGGRRIARRADAAARPLGAGCRASRFQFWLPPTVAARRTARFYRGGTGDTLKEALEPIVEKDILLVSDGHRAYPPCAAALSIRHEALNLSAGERVRDALHIQTVNSRYGQLKEFLRRYRGIATKYLDSALRWFHLIGLVSQSSPRACLAAAMNRSCIQFTN